MHSPKQFMVPCILYQNDPSLTVLALRLEVPLLLFPFEKTEA